MLREYKPPKSQKTTLQPEFLTQGSKNTLQTLNPEFLLREESVKTIKDYISGSLTATPPSNFENVFSIKAKTSTETKKSGEDDENSIYSENSGKASFYQLYAFNLKKKVGSKSGKRSKLQTGSKKYKT